jgi:hypothetical protein
MAGRGPQSFKKRQREQARKEKQEEKRAKRLQPKEPGAGPEVAEGNPILEELEGYDPDEEARIRASVGNERQ